jgi:protease I
MATLPDDTYAATPQPVTKGQSILILTADHAQDLEFFYPYYRFIEAGYRVDVATPAGGAFKGKQGMGLKQTRALADIDPSEYQLLYIPGGKAPAELKDNRQALDITRDFVRSAKPVAAICHGAQVLAAADVIKGYHIAAWPEVENEVRKAGGNYVSGPAVVDGQFITGRWPGDLPQHLAKTLEILEKQQPAQNAPRRAANA